MDDYFYGQFSQPDMDEEGERCHANPDPAENAAVAKSGDTPMLDSNLVLYDGVYGGDHQGQQGSTSRQTVMARTAQPNLPASSEYIPSLGPGEETPMMQFAPDIGQSGMASSSVEDAFRQFSFDTTPTSATFPILAFGGMSIAGAASTEIATMPLPPSQHPQHPPQSEPAFAVGPGMLSSGGPTDSTALAYGLGLSQTTAVRGTGTGTGSSTSIGVRPSSLNATPFKFYAFAGGGPDGNQYSTSTVEMQTSSSFSTEVAMNMDVAAGFVTGSDAVAPLDIAGITAHQRQLIEQQQQQQQQQQGVQQYDGAAIFTPPSPFAPSMAPTVVSASNLPAVAHPFDSYQQSPGSTMIANSVPGALAPALAPPSDASVSSTHTSAQAPGQLSLQTPASPMGRYPLMTPLPKEPNTPSMVSSSSQTASIVMDSPKPRDSMALGKAQAAKNKYSASGFDMIRALYYVSSRPNPEIVIGPVDFSCSFVVCDATLDDYPIIYVSDNFQHLTGYSNYEILGQNCRFLQAPDGKVEAGTYREFTDNRAVYHIKQRLLAGREVQQNLINYRKGGKPFLNLVTMIPIPWDDYKDGYKYMIGLQIDVVESPDAISSQADNSMCIDYRRSSIPQYSWDPPMRPGQWGPDQGRTLGMDDVSALLHQFNTIGLADGISGSSGGGSGLANPVTTEMYRQSWDKMLLENIDDVVHVLSLKGVFLYISPSCQTVLEYDASDLLGSSLSSICHPSDIVPVTREMRDTQAGEPINFVFRVRRKRSGYTWFESHGSLLVEQGKGRKCIVLVGRLRPVYALRRCDVEVNGGIGDTELWIKMSTSGMVLHMSSNSRSLLDLQPESLAGTSMQDLMRKESRAGFNRSLEKARRGEIAICHHEVQHRRGQVLQASTVMYPGDAGKGQKPTFVLGQTRLIKPSSRSSKHLLTAATGIAGSPTAQAAAQAAPTAAGASSGDSTGPGTPMPLAKQEEMSPSGSGGEPPLPPQGRVADPDSQKGGGGFVSSAGGGSVFLSSQDAALADEDNMFDELKPTRCTSWQYELRQMERSNRGMAEELGQLLANRKKRKRRKGVGDVPRDCVNCHTRNTPEWRRGPSGQRDLCNSCGLRWAKQVGRVSPRNSSRGGGGGGGGNDALSRKSASSVQSSSLQNDITDAITGVTNVSGPGSATTSPAWPSAQADNEGQQQQQQQKQSLENAADRGQQGSASFTDTEMKTVKEEEWQ